MFYLFSIQKESSVRFLKDVLSIDFSIQLTAHLFKQISQTIVDCLRKNLQEEKTLTSKHHQSTCLLSPALWRLLHANKFTTQTRVHQLAKLD
jgi:hypothetical protein